MKTILIATALAVVIAPTTGTAQVMEAVNFNTYVSPTNNDYHNHFNEFWGATGLVQITDSGITGGCLRVPNNSLTVSNAERYCSKYRNQIGAVSITSFSFKWDTTNINVSAGIQDIAELYLHASATVHANVVIWVHLHADTKLHVYNWDGGSGGSDTATTTTTPLIQYHWYNLVVTTNTIGGSFGDQMGITAELFDLGLLGTASPSMVNSLSATRSNAPFVTDTAIYINVIGAKWAGCSYIDNFTFNGYKSADSCVAANNFVHTITANEEGVSDPIPNPSSNTANLSYTLPVNVTQGELSIYNTMGMRIRTYRVDNTADNITIDNSNFSTGIYYYNLTTNGYVSATKRMVIVR